MRQKNKDSISRFVFSYTKCSSDETETYFPHSKDTFSTNTGAIYWGKKVKLDEYACN